MLLFIIIYPIHMYIGRGDKNILTEKSSSEEVSKQEVYTYCVNNSTYHIDAFFGDTALEKIICDRFARGS